MQAAQALQAHKKGIVHRDVKPDNILYAEDAARESRGLRHSSGGRGDHHLQYRRHSRALSTCPQNKQRASVGPRSDLYSLGVVLYEMLTGKAPLEARPGGRASEHAGGPPRHPRELNSEVPEALDAIVMRLLARDPAERYRSAAALVKELGRARYALPPASSSGDERPPAPYRTQRLRHVNRLRW